MAVIWQKRTKDKHYEVRQAGKSVRLYTDGVFHSQYNPNRCISRGVWDLLFLPAMFLPPGSIKRVLILGVGGGTVIHLLRRYIYPHHITGIDLDAVHLHVARRFFGITKGMANLLRDNAITWLGHYRGPKFDLIIDDLFFEHEGVGHRAIALDDGWFKLLERNLSDRGVLVINTFASSDLKQSAYCRNAKIFSLFNSAYVLSLDKFDNAVGAFLREKATVGELRRKLSQTTGLNAASGLDRLQFKTRRLEGPS